MRHESAHLRSETSDRRARPSKHRMFSIAPLTRHAYIQSTSAVEPLEEGCMRTALRHRILWVLIAVSLLPGRLLAQQTGTLSGTVHDTQGGVLPGVSVTVASPSLIGGTRTAITGTTGTYQFTS